jgi:hypothetical protein
MAVRKDAASKDETVLSALNLGKVIAEGLVIVKRLPPRVVAPRLVRAPDAVVAFVPPRAIGKVPVVPASIGRPVAFVRVALEGVPKAGVTSVGLLDRTTAPVPVDEVTPVPPLATANVPATVTAPEVAVEGVRPVEPKEIVVTPSGALVATFTKSDPSHAAKHLSPDTIVTPVVGPAPRNTIDPVPELMTAYALL